MKVDPWEFWPYMIAAAIVLPIGWWIREYHFDTVKNFLFGWIS